MTDIKDSPILRQVVIDGTDIRVLAEFYRQLFDLQYRPGDEPPPSIEPDPAGADWLVLRNGSGMGLAFQHVDALPEPTWPDGEHPQMLHLDTTVPNTEALARHRDRVLALGGRLLLDRFDDPDEPLYVFADPAGHPFCIFVG